MSRWQSEVQFFTLLFLICPVLIPCTSIHCITSKNSLSSLWNRPNLLSYYKKDLSIQKKLLPEIFSLIFVEDSSNPIKKYFHSLFALQLEDVQVSLHKMHGIYFSGVPTNLKQLNNLTQIRSSSKILLGILSFHLPNLFLN